MLVMRIRHMRVRMAQRVVVMPMAVSAHRHGVVGMLVMSIVVAMGMFMIHRLVLMRMPVRFTQVQDDAQPHQYPTEGHDPAPAAIAHRNRQRGADERGKGEHGPGARRTKCTLRQQVETQAQPVPSGADGQKCCCGAKCRKRIAKRNRQHGGRCGTENRL